MSKKRSVPVIVLTLILAMLGAAMTTVFAQELVESVTEETDAQEMDNLWEFSAGVGTFLNPSPAPSSEEETLEALDHAAEVAGEFSVEGMEGAADIVMSDADTTLDIVAGPKEDAEVVGYLYEDCGGRVLDREDGWTLIQSGDLIGWTKDENLAFGEQAYEMAAEAGNSIVVVTANALRARTAPEDDADVVTLLAGGEALDFIERVDEDWIAVDFDNETVYVAAEYVEQDFTIDTGETIEAIEKREEKKRLEEERSEAEAAGPDEEATAQSEAEAGAAAQELAAAQEAALKAQEEAEAAAQKAAEEAAAQEAAVAAQAQAEAAAAAEAMLKAQTEAEAAAAAAATQMAAAAATVDDVRLLGALIYCEAGNQSYEGKVAVGAVVMNRVKSPSYPNTIDGVIRASGQFTPVRSGKVDRAYASGVPDECIMAAQAALAGESPVGGATHFRRNNGREGQVIGAHVFY